MQTLIEKIRELAALHPPPVMTMFARARLAEHTRMTADELVQMLEQRKTKTIAVDTKENVVKELFYSEKDKQFFVAIQSATSGGVINIHVPTPDNKHPNAKQKRRALVKMGYTDSEAFKMAPNPPEENDNNNGS